MAALAWKLSAAHAPQTVLYSIINKTLDRPDLTPKQKRQYRTTVKQAFIRQKEGVPLNQVQILELMDCRSDPIW